MNLEHMIPIWMARKSARLFFRLEAPYTAEHEFKKQTNHGQYARVRFQCAPSETFSVTVPEDIWPGNLRGDYREHLKGAVIEALIDTLWSSGMMPRRGCAIVLESVGWHDIDGSEYALYQATTEAMKRLIAEGQWRLT
jgi:hypothetical protein